MPIINDEFLSDLKYLINNKEQGFVFSYSNNKGIKLRVINKIVQQAGERAGITNPNSARKHINPHLFRHSISRYLKNKRFSTEFIQNFLSHASLKTTIDIYGKMSIDEMQQEAFKYKEQALEIRRQLFGKQHPHTINSLHNLVVSLIKLRKFSDAFNCVKSFLRNFPTNHYKYSELVGMKEYIDREATQGGFRPPSKTNSKKKRKKRKR